jgi:hypothetical protein
MLSFGASGWDHDAWASAFYPDDLPGDWRLAYYANEFRAVLLPAKDWSAAGPDLFSAWREDVHEGFRFYLEVPGSVLTAGPSPQASLEALLARAEVLGNDVVLVLPGAELGDTEAQRLADAVRDSGRAYAIALVPLTTQGEISIPPGACVGCRFRLTAENLDCIADADLPLELAVIGDTGSSADPRLLRRLIEMMRRIDDRCSAPAVIFEGGPPPIESIRSAVIISDLLGG